MPAPHPAMPGTPVHWGFSSSAGHWAGAGAEPPDPWAKIRARGGSAGREHPLHPCAGTGLSYHLGGVGCVTDGSQPPREGSASPVGCGRQHSGVDEREALIPGLAGKPRGQRPVDLPNSWVRVALGPRGPRPALTHTWALRPLLSSTLVWRRQLFPPTDLLAPGKAPLQPRVGVPRVPAPTCSHWMCRGWLHPSHLGVPGRSSSSGSGGVTPAVAVTT